MEWVEITGRTLDEAKEAALSQLGIAEPDAEFEILSEGRTGLFGRLREEARVRARVRPVTPRAKRQRRSRPRREPAAAARRGEAREAAPPVRDEDSPAEQGSVATRDAPSTTEDGARGSSEGANRPRRRRSRSRGRGRGSGSSRALESREQPNGAEQSGRASNGRTSEEIEARKEGHVAHEIPLEDQAKVAREFLEGLLQSFGFVPAVSTQVLDEDTVEVAAEGEDMGLLIGPRGTTLAAVQEVTRTAVQRRFPARTDRIVVDVAGYRQRRIAALKRFTEQVAGEALQAGEEKVLEPMNPADRKVVHDTVNAMDGVATRSEGEEPSRYVVISPEG